MGKKSSQWITQKLKHRLARYMELKITSYFDIIFNTTIFGIGSNMFCIAQYQTFSQFIYMQQNVGGIIKLLHQHDRNIFYDHVLSNTSVEISMTFFWQMIIIKSHLLSIDIIVGYVEWFIYVGVFNEDPINIFWNSLLLQIKPWYIIQISGVKTK